MGVLVSVSLANPVLICTIHLGKEISAKHRQMECWGNIRLVVSTDNAPMVLLQCSNGPVQMPWKSMGLQATWQETPSKTSASGDAWANGTCFYFTSYWSLIFVV